MFFGRLWPQFESAGGDRRLVGLAVELIGLYTPNLDRVVGCAGKEEFEMPDDIRSLIKEHHAFYEVLPYYVVLEDGPIARPATTRRLQAGFDIDIYAERIKNDGPSWTPPPEKYGLGYAELQRIAENVSQHATDFCSIEVIPSPSTVVVDTRDHWKMEATFRLRLSHGRGLDQPAGLPEQRALEEVEKELKSVGFARR